MAPPRGFEPRQTFTYSWLSRPGCYHYSTTAYYMRRPTFAPHMEAFNFHSPNHPEICCRDTGRPVAYMHGARGVCRPHSSLTTSNALAKRPLCQHWVHGHIKVTIKATLREELQVIHPQHQCRRKLNHDHQTLLQLFQHIKQFLIHWRHLFDH